MAAVGALFLTVLLTYALYGTDGKDHSYSLVQIMVNCPYFNHGSNIFLTSIMDQLYSLLQSWSIMLITSIMDQSYSLFNHGSIMLITSISNVNDDSSI